jgi:hypothetical protein
MTESDDPAERVREFYRRQGEKREQERIVTLLETETRCPMKGSHHSLGFCSCLAIAYIKGEVDE